MGHEHRRAGGGWRNSGVTRRSMLVGIGAVGAFLAIDLGAVAYANDWIGKGALTRQSFIDGFRAVFGSHPGFRRNHAKGVAVIGYFDSNGRASELSTAKVFRQGRTAVTGRFSAPGGDPFIADTPSAARGLGLAFGASGSDHWRTAMMNLPVFPDNSPQGFYDRMFASKIDPATGKPDPDAMAGYLAKHPESAVAMDLIKQHLPTPGFADSTFSSLNAFYLVDASGTRTPVRWSFVAQQASFPASPKGDNRLFDALVHQLNADPLRWQLHLVVGEPSDPVTDATLQWPRERRVVVAGTLVLTSVQTEAPGNARDVNFDPLVLPEGIEPSDDPLLSTRSAVYTASYRARAGEPKSPPAVQVDEVAP